MPGESIFLTGYRALDTLYSMRLGGALQLSWERYDAEILRGLWQGYLT